MNGDRHIQWTIAKQSQDERLQVVVIGRMKAFEPCFDKVDVRVGDAVAMLDVQEMLPRLHIVKKTRIATLSRHRNLMVVEGKTWMASNIH